jgi:hypothetical protein
VYALPLVGQSSWDDEALLYDIAIDDLDIAGLGVADDATIPRHPENLDDPTNYALTTGGDPNDPTVGDELRIGLTGVTEDDLGEIEEGVIGIWVAWHARGYRRLESGDYAVVRPPGRPSDAWRTDPSGRLRGRSATPAHLLHDVDARFQRTGHADRHGFIVRRPHFPAVIVCPQNGCGARNVVRPLGTGALPAKAPHAAEEARRRRITAAFERDHPIEDLGEDRAHLPLAERERRLQERLRERKAAYQQWFRDRSR